MKQSDNIQKNLERFVRGGGYEITIPNFYFNGMYEMDMFRLTHSGIVYEYEIKISRSDYFADFKKQFKYSASKSTKHDLLRRGELPCNRFVFVVPEGLVRPDEVPDYAGLMYFTGYSFRMVKSGKMLRKKFPIDYKKLAESLSFREMFLKGKLRYAERCIADSSK